MLTICGHTFVIKIGQKLKYDVVLIYQIKNVRRFTAKWTTYMSLIVHLYGNLLFPIKLTIYGQNLNSCCPEKLHFVEFWSRSI
jgi:hypothetical protein